MSSSTTPSTSASQSSLYTSIRATVDDSGTSARVEVNQRALIDKILARYASANAVYRELLQNSNDANADTAEIYFTTTTSTNKNNVVSQVLYRNNGMPFRSQDWSRLQKIAEGNPDVSKVGAFGVGAYTMFSITEEPLVLSGESALAFIWKGDALYTKTAKHPRPATETPWTTFVLPSRDPYALPDLVELGEFLCANLTFTQQLKQIRVFVNTQERLSIIKTVVQEPRPVSMPQTSNNNSMTSWWKMSNVITTSPRGTFRLGRPDQAMIQESIHRLHVQVHDVDTTTTTSSMDARYVSAIAKTKIDATMARRMQRVTKKDPPKQVTLQLFLNAQNPHASTTSGNNMATRILQSFVPQVGDGRIFIGFRTSQTTGFAAHLSAPFVPTVEREAMDLQDPTLRIFNSELLDIAGMVMRWTLEHALLSVIDTAWRGHAMERDAWEREWKKQQQQSKSGSGSGTMVVGKKQDTTDKDEVDNDDDDDDTSSTGGIMSFARYMARGVKKKIKTAVTSVEQMLDGGGILLHPLDPRPLSTEEEEAIVLMQSFCPQQSTPDRLIGTCLAQGFSRCLTTAPPVLTRSGVVRGAEATLPHLGIENFVTHRVVRQIVLDNAQEYHLVIAQCRKLGMEHLLAHLKANPLSQEKLILLLKWWSKFSRVDNQATLTKGLELKEAVEFYPTLNDNDNKKKTTPSQTQPTVPLKHLLFYVDKDSLIADPQLPMPDSVISSMLQDQIGLVTLSDSSLTEWFRRLPMDLWTDFISHHRCMTDAMPEDDLLRLKVLGILSKEFTKRGPVERARFGHFCASLLSEKLCIPFDSTEPGQYGTACPSDLYVYSAELQAFDGIGSFHKVSAAVHQNVSEDFLLALGVRKSVSIDFLFASLDTLQWSHNPKPLVQYLRTATLTKSDMNKLATTKYLPVENDSSRTLAPSELYLPNPELRKCFPFLPLLHWPSDPEINERSETGKFLVSLGMKTIPPVTLILSYLSKDSIETKARIPCFDYLCDRLGPHGDYHWDYTRMSSSQKKKYRFIPCIVKSPMAASNQTVLELHSPETCYSEEDCGIMGFPVIDPALGENRKLYGSLFQCAPDPDTSSLVRQLFQVVATAKERQKSASGDEAHQLALHSESTFAAIFAYLSGRSSQLTKYSLDALKKEAFIPCKQTDGEMIIKWYRPDQVFFRRKSGGDDDLTEGLFQVVDFSPFLAATGVKQEATTKDIFLRMVESPQGVLDTLGSEKKYRRLLRRVAANPPFSRVTDGIRRAPFLLAYNMKQDEKGGASSSSSGDAATYQLACAKDIYIIDNSFFGRMFPVKRAPHESDLEDFYKTLGSKYISQSVDRRFEVVGKPSSSTALTLALRERLNQRSPLLVSPNITSRPLVSEAASVLDEKRLEVFEASNLMAIYSLGGTVRRNTTTCFTRQLSSRKNAIFVVEDFDWFDVGYAIGDLILTRCQLEDAFFISSLLEAPLEQLRARGFPVDRILQPEPEPESVPSPKPVPKTPVVASMAGTSGTAKAHEMPPPGGKAASSNGTNVPPPPASAAASAPADGGAQGQPNAEAFVQRLNQMFPDVEEGFVRSVLGSNPSMDDIRALAEAMAAGNYPKKDGASDTSTTGTAASSSAKEPDSGASPLKKSGKGLRKRFGKAFRGLRGPHLEGGSVPPSTGGGQGGMPTAGGTPGMREESRKPATPASDAESQGNLEDMLERTVQTSTQVDRHGVQSEDTKLTSSIPEGLDRGETCEVVPGQALKPFNGPTGNGRTGNGIRVFSARNDPSSEAFLTEHHSAIEIFALVIEQLCSVYGLKLDSVAIFHDPSGGTIAFNSNRALHFNFRFFYALHFIRDKHEHAECYSYWFVTIAHELAHHMVSGHTKEHAFYTESYAAHYLPKLVGLLGNLSK